LRFWRTPLDSDEIVIPHGEVSIIRARCKGCGICETFCPRDVLEMSTDFNDKGYHFPEVTHSEACVACGLCEIMCPEFAIFVDEVGIPS
jgi:2-oxoglutarate ferredoxin oxidoreductase subunit delta